MLITAAFLFDLKELNSCEISLTRRSMELKKPAYTSAGPLNARGVVFSLSI